MDKYNWEDLKELKDLLRDFRKEKKTLTELQHYIDDYDYLNIETSICYGDLLPNNTYEEKHMELWKENSFYIKIDKNFKLIEGDENMLNDYYILDNNSTYHLEDLRQVLINVIKTDTLENNDDEDIIKNNLDLLEKICDEKNKFNEDLIISELGLYGYEITKVKDIYKNLISFKEFFYNNKEKSKENIELGTKVETLIKDIEKYYMES